VPTANVNHRIESNGTRCKSASIAYGSAWELVLDMIQVHQDQEDTSGGAAAIGQRGPLVRLRL
jgi:hypothetical protein